MGASTTLLIILFLFLNNISYSQAEARISEEEWDCLKTCLTQFTTGCDPDDDESEVIMCADLIPGYSAASVIAGGEQCLKVINFNSSL